MRAVYPAQNARTPEQAIRTPALLAIDSGTQALEYWPIGPHGAKHQTTIGKLGLSGALTMAANGNTVAIANGSPAEVVLYDVVTKSETALADPFGTPFDVAIGKDGSIYVAHDGGGATEGIVTEFPSGSTPAVKLDCNLVNISEAIAVDNEGDVLLGAFGKSVPPGVFEIPSGSRNSCSELPLKRTQGVAGLAIDPKTDDLLVMDDPDECAGGNEGHLVVYSKPYSRTSIAHERVLGGNCAGELRLNADSTEVFYGDQDVSGSFTFIRSRGYPTGPSMGVYSGGQPAGFTTIPNSLPN